MFGRPLKVVEGGVSDLWKDLWSLADRVKALGNLKETKEEDMWVIRRDPSGSFYSIPSIDYRCFPLNKKNEAEKELGLLKKTYAQNMWLEQRRVRVRRFPEMISMEVI